MRINARIQTVIELLELVYGEDAPADVIINNYLRQRRFIGSTDRREIMQQFYDIIRTRWRLDGYLAVAGFAGDQKRQLSRLHMLTYLMREQDTCRLDIEGIFNGELFSAPQLSLMEGMIADKLIDLKFERLTEAAQLGVSEASLVRFKESFPQTYKEEITAQHTTGRLDLRVNILKTDVGNVERLLKKEKILYEKSTYSPWGLRLKYRMPLSNHKLLTEGLVEIQDEGSQLVAMTVGAKPGMLVWDYCAGAGGKSLAMAAMMQNKGRLIASDALAWRLNKAPQRFRRAGIHNIECRALEGDNLKWVKRQYGKSDRVLVDAPCSGSGTWRRNPELKWRMTDKDIAEICVKQAEILDKASNLVKPGGRLIYATCSLYAQENQEQITSFLERHPNFTVIPVELEIEEKVNLTPEGYLQLTPFQHGMDGFFACVMERKVEIAAEKAKVAEAGE